MEETGTNIHIGLVRRNNFLRENPTSCEIVALLGKMPGRGAFRGASVCELPGLTPRRIRTSASE
ncbi:hypothetical protein HDG35_003067 [Paraburkholderia sp. JPY681]|nr:hypothetical protein [Paraburkholderia atlantica]